MHPLRYFHILFIPNHTIKKYFFIVLVKSIVFDLYIIL